ncbi:hypothetical protein ZWY2020_028543 [Hordeum vulgare]|nr:hypothetical protein ZWY2020_028543 [Hordeum vulgare]
MSGLDDSHNDFREQSVEMDSRTRLEKSASDPNPPSSHGLPKAATRQRKKHNYDEADSDFMHEETLAPPKAPPRKVVRKIYGSAANLRAPDYVRKNTSPSTDDAPKKDEEDNIPAPPKKKLMADAIKFAPNPPKDNKYVAHWKTRKDIPVAAKKKGPAWRAPAAEEEDDEDATILRKIIPHLLIHNDAHPIAEDM